MRSEEDYRRRGRISVKVVSDLRSGLHALCSDEIRVERECVIVSDLPLNWNTLPVLVQSTDAIFVFVRFVGEER